MPRVVFLVVAEYRDPGASAGGRQPLQGGQDGGE